MPGPPDSIEASALWVELQSTPRPFRVIPFPRKRPDGSVMGNVAIWVLTQEEQFICNAAAEKKTREILKLEGSEVPKKDETNLAYIHTFGNAAQVEILWRCCRNEQDPSKPAFPSPNLMAKILTTDELATLFRHYLTVQLELGPIVAHMSKEEMEAWIRKLHEGGSAFPFDTLSSELQTTLLLFLVSEVVKFWTATSSAGSPPEEAMPERAKTSPPPPPSSHLSPSQPPVVIVQDDDGEPE